MIRSNSKSVGNHVASAEEEEKRLQWEGFADKESFKSMCLNKPYMSTVWESIILTTQCTLWLTATEMTHCPAKQQHTVYDLTRFYVDAMS